MNEARPPDTSAERIYVVDRIEGATAVLVPDSSNFRDENVPAKAFRTRVAEGDVLRVPVQPDGVLAWENAAVDPKLAAQRLEAAAARLERLRRRDPGGDIVL